MKAKTKLYKLLSVLLCCVMLAGMLPTTAYAWDTVIDCEFCGKICGDDYICDGGDHCSEASGRDCYEAHHCITCGACLSDATRCPMCYETCSECGHWCDTCEVCLDCAIENHAHCAECGECLDGDSYCMICFRCFNCGGVCSEGCDDCCLDCHHSEGAACENCDTCYVNDDSVYCPTCKLCHNCTGGYCESCGQCGSDVILCGGCGMYCSECVPICEECGAACTECNEELCPSCYTCNNCVVMCGNCYNCVKCFDLCSSCGLCEECTDLCESCHAYCIECVPMCVDCGLCEFCALTLCDNCGEYCADCATLCDGCSWCEDCADICQGCYEACSNCSTICEKCGMCLYCCIDGIVIDSIDVTITEPVAGFLSEKNIVVNSDRFTYSSVRWKHNGANMATGERFVAGDTYIAHFFMVKQPNDIFADDVKVIINGSIPGTNIQISEDNISYYAEFTAVAPVTIDTVDVKVTAPVAGAHPQDVVSNTDHAIVTAMEWRCDGKLLSASDTFEEGVTYQLTVAVGVESNKYEFTDDTIVTFNGANTGNYVTNDYDHVIYEAWFKAAAAPTGYTVSGTATSFGSDTDNVILQLIAEGYSEADYEVFVKGNTAEYSIEGVAPGTYTMKVMKNNHVTREYTVTVSAENVTQDVKMQLKGDVNGDGTINAKDKKIIYGHINDSSTELTGYIFDVGDVNKDGVINAKDKKQIFGHINGTSLWS